jgi:hypothetical protein
MASLHNNAVIRILAHKEPVRGPPEQFFRAGNESKVWEPIADTFLGSDALTWKSRRRADLGFDRDVGPFGVLGCNG